MIDRPDSLCAPIRVPQILRRYRPRVYRMDRNHGLAIVLLDRADVPGAIHSVHPALLCWGMLFPFPLTGGRATWHDPRIPLRGTTEIARRSHYLYGLSRLGGCGLDYAYPLDEQPWDTMSDEEFDARTARNDQAMALRRHAVLRELPAAELTHVALDWEDDVWHQLDAPRMARIWAQIEPFMPTLRSTWQHRDDHWLWQGAVHQGRPATSFGTSRHVPVVRLLWTVDRPGEPIYDGQGKALRPRQDVRKCTLWNCVNPRHFERSIPVRIGRSPNGIGSGNYSTTGGLRTHNYRWTVNTPSVEDPQKVFPRIILCPLGHRFGNAAQIAFNRALKGEGPSAGTGYCGKCYKIRREETPAPARPRKGQPVDPALARMTQQFIQKTPITGADQGSSDLLAPPAYDMAHDPHLFDDLNDEDQPA